METQQDTLVKDLIRWYYYDGVGLLMELDPTNDPWYWLNDQHAAHYFPIREDPFDIYTDAPDLVDLRITKNDPFDFYDDALGG
jgi:hypothetical protein